MTVTGLACKVGMVVLTLHRPLRANYHIRPLETQLLKGRGSRGLWDTNDCYTRQKRINRKYLFVLQKSRHESAQSKRLGMYI